jgi:cytochrome c oxidase subunit 2
MLAAGCSGSQSALDPAGPLARRISHLWWFMLVVCSVIFLLVISAFLYGLWRARRRDDVAKGPASERRMISIVGSAVVTTVIVLFAFLIVSVLTGRQLSAVATPQAITISVIGHQWWWEVHYLDQTPSQQVTTANEIHVPVGQPVLLKLTSHDVIHSFWAPNLQGKRDLIPGHETRLWLQADRPGVFRGQCAEFCGHQHAHMAFLLVAEPPDQFAAWLEQQRHPAVQPADAMTKRGQEVFLSSACVLCHAIQGTEAFANVAPDLTHLASRRTIAAATLPNTRGHLAGWIIDSQQIKPGNKMPPTTLDSQDLHALLAYLESLQ